MTTNQINYWRYKEDQRHNVVYENETHRHNVATELQAQNELSERIRSNLRQEELTLQQNVERERSNRANEQIAWFSASEVRRSNMAKESETQRHNLAIESETVRSNKAEEDWRNRSLQETIRSNQAYEDYRDRSLAEQKRHNIITEATETALSAWQKAETVRHNKASEENERLSIESKRKNYTSTGNTGGYYNPTYQGSGGLVGSGSRGNGDKSELQYTYDTIKNWFH